MGRYYSGDIEGKFWFALQSSIAADRFRVPHYQPEYVMYRYTSDDLPGVIKEINNIEKNLGDKLQVIEKLFEEKMGYNDQMLVEAGITRYELSEYADLGLGIQIRDYIIENGECTFDAEL